MKRKVKAWAVIGKDGLFSCSQYSSYDIYPSPKGAVVLRRVLGISKGWSVVPCTITYTLPTKERKRNKPKS